MTAWNVTDSEGKPLATVHGFSRKEAIERAKKILPGKGLYVTKVKTYGIPYGYIETVMEEAKRAHAADAWPTSCAFTPMRLDRIGGRDMLSWTDQRVTLVSVEPIEDDPCKWAVDVQYSTTGARALYGVREDGTVQLWEN